MTTPNRPGSVSTRCNRRVVITAVVTIGPDVFGRVVAPCAFFFYRERVRNSFPISRILSSIRARYSARGPIVRTCIM